MGNLNSIIARHNKKVLSGEQNQPPDCQCEHNPCPVEGKCASQGVIYQATVKQTDGTTTTDSYIGLTERKFLDRYKEHYTNFESRHPKNCTKLSKTIWSLEDQQRTYEIKWKILQEVKPYKAGNSECCLCLMEIYFIIFQPEKASLNSRNEMLNKCRHKNKYKLSKF